MRRDLLWVLRIWAGVHHWDRWTLRLLHAELSFGIDLWCPDDLRHRELLGQLQRRLTVELRRPQWLLRVRVHAQLPGGRALRLIRWV